jgi:hypothetical protein
MTDQRTQMQAAFCAAVDEHTEGLTHVSSGACPTCEECQALYGMTADEISSAQESGALPDEPHIGRHCDTCGVSCQQSLYDGHALADGALVHLAMCADCVCWFANGDLPRHWEGWHDVR